MLPRVESEPTKTNTPSTDRQLILNIRRKLKGIEKQINKHKSLPFFLFQIRKDIKRISDQVQNM